MMATISSPKRHGAPLDANTGSLVDAGHFAATWKLGTCLGIVGRGGSIDPPVAQLPVMRYCKDIAVVLTLSLSEPLRERSPRWLIRAPAW